ncbi:MAG: GNAT family N-acetyltransferase [Acidobacteriia bacterium]|nr:GNAT family N-acetyltransferase [Terriglobia bacterium]
MSPGKPPCNLEPGPIPTPSPTSASQPYSIEPIRSEEALSSLQEDWNRLSETAELPNVFMTFDWFRAWNQRRAREHRRGQRRLEVLVLKKDGVVAGIAPLIYRATSRFGFLVRRLESLASPADYSDLVVGDDPAGQIEAIVNFLVQTKDQWDLVDLKSLRETGNFKALIQSALSHTSLTYRILPEDRCPYLPIDASWSGVVSRLSRAGHRLGMGMRTLRNKQHRLERMGAEGLRVRIIENPQDEPGLLEKLIVLEKKRVEGKLMAPFLARYPEVFHSLFDTLGRRGWVYVALMEHGDRPVASLMGFRCGKKLWYYQGAYDHSFSRLSPGTMLFLTVLDYGFSHGYREYDFLTGDEPYKMAWSADFHETFRLQIWSTRGIRRAHLAWGAVYRLFRAGE